MYLNQFLNIYINIMGNATSVNDGGDTKQKDLSQVLNFIATNYILTQSFKDLESLNDPKYCNQMVILTSDVLKKYLTNRDVKYLAQK